MAQWFNTSADEAIETNALGFESGENQLQFDSWVAGSVLFV